MVAAHKAYAVHMHKHMFIDYDLMFSCCVVQYYKSTVRRFQTITFNMKLIRIKNELCCSHMQGDSKLDIISVDENTIVKLDEAGRDCCQQVVDSIAVQCE